MTTTAVRVNSSTYTATHVATNMLRGLKQIITGCGLDAAKFTKQFETLENGVATWVRSGHLQSLVLEVWDPAKPSVLVGRFDFEIDYGYHADGDGELWLDSEAVAWAIKKNGAYPSKCDYRVVADTAPGEPAVDGWTDTTLRDTSGMRRHSVGTALGGGSSAAALSYWKPT